VLGLFIKTPLFLLDVLGIPCVLLTLLSGGVRRTLLYRTSYYWLALAAWMVLAIPFSSWRGGSFYVVLGYLRTSVVMLFVMSGMVMTWKECVRLVWAVALGGLASVITTSTLRAHNDADRIASLLPSIGNANDLAAHLLLVLPFVCFIFLVSRNWIVRSSALAVALFGTYFVMGTGSRGALVAVGVTIVYVLAQAPGRIRLAVLIVVPIGLVVVAALLPREVLIRYATLVDSTADAEDPGVQESADERTYLLQTSALFSLRHPLFGVGPGEFEDEEATYAKENRRHASWLVPHNTYTQMSSEAGVPALILLVAALAGSFKLLNTTYKQARSRSEFEAIRIGAFCAMVAMVGFCTAVFFLSLAYHFYFSAIGGIAIAIHRAAQAEFHRASSNPSAARA